MPGPGNARDLYPAQNGPLIERDTIANIIKQEQPESVAVAVTAPPDRPKTAAKQIKSRVGKPVQFWLHEEDRRLVRELAAWLAGQGERPTDSLVIRSVLHTATTGSDLLKAYRQASQLDGRLKQHKTT